ncbi:MAG: hypothetical protein NVS1B10_02620 [Candidatus Saccharimonadales bacterium]
MPGYPCTDHGKPPPKGTGNCLTDYDFLNPGPISLRYALGGSRNIPAVKAMYEAVPNDKSGGNKDSVNKVISTASAMMDNTYLQSKHKSAYNCYKPGIDVNNATPDDTTQCYGAAAIGDGAFLHLDDHVNGLATLGRLGKAIPRTYILKITDASQKTLYEWKQPLGNQVIKADTAYIVNNMASDYKASYLPGSCSETNCTPISNGGYKFQKDNGWDFAVKTGTTNSGFDGLMTSWSTRFAVVSWVGNHTRNVDISARTGTSMENLTEPLTRGMMEAAHANITPVKWTQPTTIKTAPAFVVRNHIHYGDIEPSPTNDLYPGWYAGGGNTKNTAQTIDKVSGKTATSCTPPLAKITAYNANAASYNIDIYNGGKQSIGSLNVSPNTPTQNATDDVHNCNDSPPTVTLTAPASCDTTCTITATVTQGTHALSDPQYPQYPGEITFSLGGQTIHSQSLSESPSTVSFQYSPTSSGSDKLSAFVTDSVLYQGSASATMSFSVPQPQQAGGNNQPLSGFTATLTDGNKTIKFDWSGGTPNYSVFSNDGTTLCKEVASTSCTTPYQPSITTVTLKDSTGASATATVH